MKLAACLVLAITLLACRAPPLGGPREAMTNRPDATSFLSENDPPPADTSTTTGDVVKRDAYGRPFDYALLGEPFPAFTAPMMDGEIFGSATLRDWTVVHIWGVWCEDSRADAPFVGALTRAIAQDPDLDFISIHVPQNAARTSDEHAFGKFGSIDAYLQSVGHDYPVIVDADARLRALLKVTWTPSYLLVSPDGVVRGFRTELAAAGGEPVKGFLRDVAKVKGDVRKVATIGPGGAMALGRQTVFTLPAIAAAFPGHEIVATVEGEGKDAMPVFLVRAPDGDTRFRVEPDWTRGYVGAVSTRDPAVRGPAATAIGEMRLKDIPPAKNGECRPAADAPDQVVCITPAAADGGAFVRLFGPAADGGGAVLIEMAYLPPQQRTKSP